MRRHATRWLRWVAANALGEMLGLGGTFAVGAIIIPSSEEFQSVGRVLGSFLAAVGSAPFALFAVFRVVRVPIPYPRRAAELIW